MKRKHAAFLFIGLGLLALVLAVFFLLQGGLAQQPPPEAEGDTIPPVTAIFSPDDKSWHGAGFLATILDSDLTSGLPEGRECQYIIQDLGTREAVGGVRPCERVQVFIPVGEGKTCSSTFDVSSSRGRCLLSSRAVDRAGNESPWESAVFLIDLTAPVVSRASLPAVVQPGEEYVIEATVSDNGKVVRCDFFVDGTPLDQSVSLDPLPCQEWESCTLSFSHAFSEPGEYEGAFACLDAAGNAGFGEQAAFRVFVNKGPEIASCRVVPAQGSASTAFQFEAIASDPDGDSLSFAWNFGDGSFSDLASPTHSYPNPGTFMPRVEVADPGGEKSSCATAWVIVE
ncbi:MAG: PKD domain-containing protein [bacterium]|nr:PKD domain-containing protein [bacterium]